MVTGDIKNRDKLKCNIICIRVKKLLYIRKILQILCSTKIYIELIIESLIWFITTKLNGHTLKNNLYKMHEKYAQKNNFLILNRHKSKFFHP